MAQLHEGHRQRLRNLYANSGIEHLEDHQVLELLLTYAIPRKDTNELAHRLLNQFGSLENVLRADFAQLQSIDGIGESAALFLRMQNDVAQLILQRRLVNRRGRIFLGCPQDAAQYALSVLFNKTYESVCVTSLDSNRFVKHTQEISSGTLSETPVYARLAVEAAMYHRAHSIILLHNHPSGSVLPSDADMATTETVRHALMGVGVRLYDHFIVGYSYVYSTTANMVFLVTGSYVEIISPEEYITRLREDTERCRMRERAIEPYL